MSQGVVGNGPPHVSRSLGTAWLRRLPGRSRAEPTGDGRLRLICLPYAGGSASLFWGLGKVLPARVEVIAVELPGRSARIREEPCRSIGSLVDAVAGALQPLLDCPVVLLGHSMGALIAFELARRMRALRLQAPAQLMVGGFPAPHLERRSIRISSLCDEQFLARLQRRYGSQPHAASPAYTAALKLLVPALRADVGIVEDYVYREEPPLACPISAFLGTRDVAHRAEDLKEWSRQTTSSFALREISGDHYSVLAADTLGPYVLAEIGWML